ncbi:MAG TPA: hypothetical protein VNM22_06125 [Candidatus Limnocylindrales bacterium]|nr:hypothetical protein [Candidatus Limnocylindrales bacterium]
MSYFKLKILNYFRVFLFLGLFSLSGCFNILQLTPKDRPPTQETGQRNEVILKDFPISSPLPQGEEQLSEAEAFLENANSQKTPYAGYSDQAEFYSQFILNKAN